MECPDNWLYPSLTSVPTELLYCVQRPKRPHRQDKINLPATLKYFSDVCPGWSQSEESKKSELYKICCLLSGKEMGILVFYFVSFFFMAKWKSIWRRRFCGAFVFILSPPVCVHRYISGVDCADTCQTSILAWIIEHGTARRNTQAIAHSPGPKHYRDCPNTWRNGVCALSKEIGIMTHLIRTATHNATVTMIFVTALIVVFDFSCLFWWQPGNHTASHKYIAIKIMFVSAQIFTNIRHVFFSDWRLQSLYKHSVVVNVVREWQMSQYFLLIIDSVFQQDKYMQITWRHLATCERRMSPHCGIYISQCTQDQRLRIIGWINYQNLNSVKKMCFQTKIVHHLSSFKLNSTS